MSVSVTYTSNLTVVETLAANVAAMSDRSVTHSLFNTQLSAQNAQSSPPAVLVASFEQAMADGSATIDLTALTGTNGAVVSGTGLRVQYMKLINKSSNANSITIAKGASDGYDGFGGDFSVTLAPGAEMLLRTKDAGGDIGSSNKTLDVSGVGSQVLQAIIVMG